MFNIFKKKPFLTSLLEDNILILEPILENEKLRLDANITKNALTFFKYLLQHFKPINNINDFTKQDNNTILARRNDSKKQANNELFSIYIKEGHNEEKHRWFNIVVYNEDFDRKDYDNALSNFISAYLKDEKENKPIYLKGNNFKSIVVFFNQMDTINANSNVLKNLSGDIVSPNFVVFSPTDIFRLGASFDIKYKDTVYTLVDDSVTLINNVFANEQILSLQDFKYKYDFSNCIPFDRPYEENIYKENETKKDSFFDPYSNTLLAREYALLDEVSNLKDTAKNTLTTWLAHPNSILIDESANNINFNLENGGRLFLDSLGTIAKNLLQNMLLNANASLSKEDLLLLKQQNLSCKIAIKDARNLSFEFTFIRNPLKSKNESSWLDDVISVQDGFNVSAGFYVYDCGKENDPYYKKLVNSLFEFAKNLSYFDSISPIDTNYNYLNVESSYNLNKKIINDKNLIFLKSPNDVVGNNFYARNFFTILKNLYADFVNNLVKWCNFIKSNNSEVLKNNLETLKQNKVKWTGNEKILFYNWIHDKDNTAYKIDSNTNDLLFLKYKDGTVLPFSAANLLNVSLNAKKEQLHTEIANKINNKNFNNTLKELNEALKEKESNKLNDALKNKPTFKR